MILRTYKPITSGTRHKIGIIDEQVTYRDRPMLRLVQKVNKSFGKNNTGRLTCKTKRSGRKLLYRQIDFKRDNFNVLGTVVRIEYDPNRSANIALIKYQNGEYRYIICPRELKVNDNIISNDKDKIQTGNAMLLENMPIGTIVHNLELNIGQGGRLIRSAGSGAKILSFDNNQCLIKMPSGEKRYINKKCRAVIGEVGNIEHRKIRLGKAGTSFHKGVRPKVRGSAKNPVDHPHGGGNDRSPIGRIPVNVNGLKFGTKTRKKRKYNNKFIVSRGKKKK